MPVKVRQSLQIPDVLRQYIFAYPTFTLPVPAFGVPENGSYYGEPNANDVPRTVYVNGYFRQEFSTGWDIRWPILSEPSENQSLQECVGSGDRVSHWATMGPEPGNNRGTSKSRKWRISSQTVLNMMTPNRLCNINLRTLTTTPESVRMRTVYMATLQQEIRDKFLTRLSKDLDVTKIEELKKVLADGKKPKPDDFVKIFSLPAAGDLK